MKLSALILIAVTIASLILPLVIAPFAQAQLTPEEQRQALEAEGAITPEQQRAANEAEPTLTCSVGLLSAEGVLCIFAKLIDWFVFGALKQFVRLAGYLLDTAIDTSSQSAGASFVMESWIFVRDLSNLMMILILLVIGFATILQVESWGVKQALPRLILVALLINFSLVITQFVIDFSNVLGFFFLDIARGGGTGAPAQTISEIIAGGLSTGRLVKEAGIAIEAGTSRTWQQLMAVIVGGLGGSVVLLVTTFILFAAATLIVIRIIYLWLLMILSPGAFLMWILPATRGYFSNWMSQLVRWSFFIVAYFFMLALTIKLIATLNLSNIFPNQPAGILAWNEFISIPGLILKYILITFMLFISLIWANQMGIAGASTFMGWGKKAGGWARGKAWQYTKEGAGMMAGRARPLAERTIGRIPFAGKYAMRGVGVVAEEKEKAVKERAKAILGRSDKFITENWKSFTKATQDRILRDIKADRFAGIIQKLPETDARTLRDRARGTPLENRIHAARPTLFIGQMRSQGLTEHETQGAVDAFMAARTRQEKRSMNAETVGNEFIQSWLRRLGTENDIRDFGNTKEKVDELVAALRSLGPEVEKIAGSIEDLDNPKLAKYIRTSPWMQVNLNLKAGAIPAGTAEGRIAQILEAAEEEGEGRGRETGRQEAQQGGGTTP